MEPRHRTAASTVGRHLSAVFRGLAVLISIGFLPPSVYALDIVPFETSNQNPLVQIFGLPSAGNAILLSPGEKAFRLTLDHGSTYVEETDRREALVLDGETTRLTLGARYGLAKNLEVGIAIPYLSHRGGFLDGFIVDYHDAFGFPQGGRDRAPRNRLLYRYSRNAVEKLKLDSSESGIGDIMLTAGYQLYHNEKEYPLAVALRASVKLPTGDSASLNGSGSTDASLWFAAQEDFPLPIGRGSIFAAAGVTAMTDGDILPEEQRNFAGFGSFGLGWSPLSWIALKVQLDAHTAVYRDSDLKALGATADQLVMGGTLGFSERLALDIGVSEDVVTETAPDVAFHFNLRYRF